MGLLEQIREMDLQEAKDEGLKLGMQEGKLEIARSMLSKGMDIDLVKELTGLPKTQLKKLETSEL